MQCLALFLSLLAPATAADITPEAKQYLDAALSLIERKSVKRETDWSQMRSKAYDVAKDAKKPADTYEAIRVALRFVADHHSGFFTPEMVKMSDKGQRKGLGLLAVDGYLVRVNPKGPADKAGLRKGMRFKTVGGKEFKSDEELYALLYAGDECQVVCETQAGQKKSFKLQLGVFDDYLAPESKLINGKYGYVAIPGFNGQGERQQRFANQIQDAIQKLDKPGLRGWIVDLRLDTGGNMFPMIAGLGPLLDNGTLGAFIEADGEQHWFYKEGTVGVDKESIVRIKPYRPKQSLPVAVIMDRFTASSGEATAISFAGQSNVVFLGGDSAGLTTGNEFEKLSDGAFINLCEAVEADRTGKKYGEKMHPDIPVKTDWSLFASPKDTAILEAIKSIESRINR